MTAAGAGRRFGAAPATRRVATVVQAVVGAAAIALAWYGGRLVGLFWPERAEPEVATLLALLAGALTLAILSLALLIVLLHDLVKVTIDVRDEGLAVDRWIRPFEARWDELREVGLAPATGDLTVRGRTGTVTVSRRLLGTEEFATLVALLHARAGHAVHTWTRWQTLRRQLLLVAGPALGFTLLLALGREIVRRRTGRAGSRR